MPSVMKVKVINNKLPPILHNPTCPPPIFQDPGFYLELRLARLFPHNMRGKDVYWLSRACLSNFKSHILVAHYTLVLFFFRPAIVVYYLLCITKYIT